MPRWIDLAGRALLVLGLAWAQPVLAWQLTPSLTPQGPAELRVALYTLHYSRSPEHKFVKLVGLNQALGDQGYFAGASLFTNSFGQPSAYAYLGRRYPEPLGWKRSYWHWSAGLIYGYRPPYENKVPLNYKGFSPGLIPGVGYWVTERSAIELNVLGTAGINLLWNYRLE